MKKIYLILCSSALVLFSGCNKESVSEVVNGQETKAQETDISGLTLAGTLENVAASGSQSAKTTIGEIEHEGKTQKYAVWSANDKISVFDENGNVIEMELKDELSPKSTKGLFRPITATAENFGTPTYAVYPSSLNATIAGTTVSLTLPAIQYYAENSFADNTNVAVSKITNGKDANFKNVCGYLKLQLKGDFKVGKIKVSGHNDEKLNGKFNVDLSSIDNINEFKGAVATSDRTEGDDVITLDCTGTAAGGVQLNTETAITFYVVVPVDAFAHGFAVRVYDAEGTEHPFALLTTAKNNVIERSAIKAMPEISTEAPAYVEVSYISLSALDKSGTKAGLNLGIKADMTTKSRLDYSVKGDDSNYIFGYRDATEKIWYGMSGSENGGTINACLNGKSVISSYKRVSDKYRRFIITLDAQYKTATFNYVTGNASEKLNIDCPDWDGETAEPLRLFGNGYNAPKLDYRVFSLRIWKLGVAQRYLVPCYTIRAINATKDGTDSIEVGKGEIGMVDLMSGKMFVNYKDNPSVKFGKSSTTVY